MKVIIFGATGGTGRELVSQALEQGHLVTAFVRNPAKLGQQHDNLQAIKGDVLDYESVEQAIGGQDAVMCLLGMPSPFDKSRIREKGTANIVRAMQETGVKRLICQSSLGVGASRDILPFQYKYLILPTLLRKPMADHAVQETCIKNSTLDWTIIRPATLTDGERSGDYWHGFQPGGKKLTIKIPRADVAEFSLKQLANNRYLHESPVISGYQ